MVFFICNHCGESLKKQAVSNHAFRCKRDINVSCMDCQKDFVGQAYDAHIACISEAEKYSAKGFVPKVNKGVQKQENWINEVRLILERKKDLAPGVKRVFETIKQHDNIPRKIKPFINFFQNSNRAIGKNDVETAWNLIEQELKKEKQTPVQKNGADLPAKNGTTAPDKDGETEKGTEKSNAPVNQKKLKTKQSSENEGASPPKKQKKAKTVPENSPEEAEPQPTKQKKRKTKDTPENGHAEEESHPSKQKKRKTKDSAKNGNENGDETNGANGTDAKAEEQEQNEIEEKINIGEAIRELLVSQNNQMKLSKLKKKVMKRYQQATGGEVDGKFEKKFQKKIAKIGCVVENDTVRLVEA